MMMASTAIVMASPTHNGLQHGQILANNLGNLVPDTLSRRTSYNKNCDKYNGNYIKFTPDNLVLDDLEFDTPFNVSLTAKPVGDVTVYLSAPGCQFIVNKVTFNGDNWNKPVEVRLVGVPEFMDKDDSAILITADVDAPCENYHTCQTGHQCHRKYTRGGTCTSSGDPHYHTFNGLDVTHMGKGAFYLVESDILSIQAYQYPCVVVPGHDATCNGAIGIRYGDDAFIVSIAKADFTGYDPTKNDLPRLERLSDDIRGVSYTPADGKPSKNFNFKMDDGATVSVSIGSMNGLQWLDVNIFIPGGYWGKVGGICNIHSDDDKDDKKLHCKDGKKVSKDNDHDVNYWAYSWAVPDNDNIFHGKYTVGQKTYPLNGKKNNKCYHPTTGCSATTYGTCTKTSSTVWTTKTKPTLSSTTSSSIKTTSSVSSSSSVSSKSSTSSTSSTMSSTTSSTSSSSVVSSTSSTLQTSTTTSTSSSYIVSTTTTTTTTTCTIPVYTPTSYTYCTGTPVTYTPTPTPTTSSTSVVVSTSTSSSIKSTSTTNGVSTTSYVQSSTSTTKGVSTSSSVYVPSSTVPTYTPYQIQPQPTTTVDQATTYCKQLLNAPGCSDICPTKYAAFLSACVSDIVSSGTYLFCETTRQSYNDYCSTLSHYLQQSDNQTTATVAQQVIYGNGYANYTCANSCSGHGDCTSYGCVCHTPYSGADCSIDQSTLPYVPPPYAGGQNATVVSNTNKTVNGTINKNGSILYNAGEKVGVAQGWAGLVTALGAFALAALF
ncbi:hypothetical protein HDU76_007637 [Blyttiomyces sp. JEL0837]|nr:hypothetical protein HDU76_007637 [Blyttiomyces sp. JEL0837]